VCPPTHGSRSTAGPGGRRGCTQHAARAIQQKLHTIAFEKMDKILAKIEKVNAMFQKVDAVFQPVESMRSETF